MNPIAYGMIGTFQDRWCSLIIIKLQFVYQKYRLTGAMQDQYTDWAAEMPPSISKCSKNNSISLSKPSAKQSCSCSNIKVNFPQNSFLISDIWIVFFFREIEEVEKIPIPFSITRCNIINIVFARFIVFKCCMFT